MSIKLCQATGSTVTPLDDARLYSWIANRAVGIVTGCTVTSAGTNQLSIAAGWGVCQGHMFTISAETIGAVLATSGTLPGRLLIHIDTADTDMPVKFVTQAASILPALTQEDIDGSGSIYEIPLATYTAGTISISDLTSAAPAAPSLQSEIDSLNASYATLNQNLVHTLHGTTCMDTSPYLGHVVFSTPMKNTDYSIMLTPRCTVDQSANTAVYGACVYNKTVNGFDYTAGGAAGSSSWYVDWTVIY